MVSLSCIIPAFNEAIRIPAVLQEVTSHPLIDEVIVVDDGSTDDTSYVAGQFNLVQVIRNSTNQGKSAAVCRGIRASSGSVLFLLDADLIGLSSENISSLIKPVTERFADASISLRGNALPPWRWLGLDYVSGERVFPRDLIAESLAEIETLAGFGLEVHLNQLLTQRRCRLSVVPWNDVQSPYKSVKYGFWAGAAAEIRMLGDIAQTVPLAESASQIGAMLRARI
jgi:hypothetical protein